MVKLRNRVYRGIQLSVVFTALIVSRLLYALPAWEVFGSAADGR